MNWWKIAILIQIASSYAFENYPSKFRKHFFQKLVRTNIIFTFTVNYFRLWQIKTNFRFWFSCRTTDQHWQSKLFKIATQIVFNFNDVVFLRIFYHLYETFHPLESVTLAFNYNTPETF